MTIKVKLMSFGAVVPFRTTPGSAGMDLYSVEAGKILVCDRILVSTGIALGLPYGTYGRIAPRSSLALKGIDVAGGVIDSDYTGIVKVLLVNNSKEDFYFDAGERIAQLIIEKCDMTQPILIEELQSTIRGNKGFGSTGI